MTNDRYSGTTRRQHGRVDVKAYDEQYRITKINYKNKNVVK